MTLKTRLAAMMVLVLVAVVAVQFVLAERERRELGARLAQLSSELDRSTAFFVERVHEMATLGAPEQVQREVRAFMAGIRPDSGASRPQTTLRVLVFSDSVSGRRHSPAFGAQAPGTAAERFDRDAGHEDSLGLPAESRNLWWSRVETIVVRGDTAAHRRVESTRSAPAAATAQDRDFIVNLPLPPGAGADSVYSIQMRYSYASLAEELSRSRRRSLIWLAALLGLGTAAAVAVAGRFTRPIRALEASFARVRAGDLATRVRPERRDEIGHLTASFNDMVARLRESQEMSDRLAQAEHLASIGRLAAGVAHEVRNPLNAILLNLQQMRDRAGTGREATPAAAELDKYHHRIAGEIQRLEHLVGTFLDLAKSGELRCERIDVAASLRTAVDLFRPVALERGIRLDLGTMEPLLADADPQRLPAVWNNLLANALQAAPPGGHVQVRASAHADRIDVEIEDDGAGIPAELHDRVFEPFQSGREGGTGLGLAIVRATVESHGGRVELDSAPGRGTRVRVVLPRARRPEEAA